jgi:outer membrane biosynthesis protein TonB
MRPVVHSARTSATGSWTGDPTGTSWAPAARARVPFGDRAAAALLVIASGAVLAVLASLAFMHAAESRTAAAPATQAVEVQPVAEPSVAAEPSPAPSTIAPPDTSETEDGDVEVQPLPKKRAPIATPKPAATWRAKPPTQPAKDKPPSASGKNKALGDLLQKLGEEQLKR